MVVEKQKTTIPRLKEIVLVGYCGYSKPDLSSGYPYYLNKQNLDIIQEGIDYVTTGMYKNIVVTDVQKNSLDNWIADLREEFLE